MRFVVVEIPDNEEAEAFVHAVRRGQVLFAKPAQSEETGEAMQELTWQPPAESWAVPQVYAVPTLFCECPIRHPEARSKRYGWYVCTKCAKPRRGSMQHPFNMVERHKDAKDVAFYMGFRSDRMPWRLPKAK